MSLAFIFIGLFCANNVSIIVYFFVKISFRKEKLDPLGPT